MEIMTEAMPVGLCSVTAPSRSAARGAPVKADGRDPRVRRSRLDPWIGQTHRGEDGDLWDQVPTNEGSASAPPPTSSARSSRSRLRLRSRSAPAASGALELTELN